jgi:hypothetical protein
MIYSESIKPKNNRYRKKYITCECKGGQSLGRVKIGKKKKKRGEGDRIKKGERSRRRGRGKCCRKLQDERDETRNTARKNLPANFAFASPMPIKAIAKVERTTIAFIHCKSVRSLLKKVFGSTLPLG